MSTPLPPLLLASGETSGEHYAAELLAHLQARHPGLQAFGLGGDRLEARGAQLVAHVRDLHVVGLVEVLRHLRRLRGIFHAVLSEVDRRRPAVAVLVDYPDFNLRLARELKRRGVRVAYYVSPQVWAWRRGRVRQIRDTVAHMIVIFPFEEPLYRSAGVPVTFVGHPLVETVRPALDRAAFRAAHAIDPGQPLVAVLPGSRPQEVAHNLPPIAGALRQLAQERPRLQFVLGAAPGLPREILTEPLSGLPVRIVTGATHSLMGAADAGIVASGTATVEAALLGLPMVVVYRLSRLTYALGRPLVRVPHYAMANLIAGREVVKELIQHEFRASAVAAEVLRLLDDGTRRQSVIEGLADVRRRLGGPGASARAAEVVSGLITKKD